MRPEAAELLTARRREAAEAFRRLQAAIDAVAAGHGTEDGVRKANEAFDAANVAHFDLAQRVREAREEARMMPETVADVIPLRRIR